VTTGANDTPLGTPFDHVYVEAPPPVKVAVCPEQSEGVLAVAVTLGLGWIDTEIAAVFEPHALAPVTIKLVEEGIVNGTPLVIPPVQV
jgi:hypothetical protein